MTDLRKAAEMALASLESIGMPTQSVRESINALRQALAQEENT
jgi:HPt (histidine-containing phosphotransfer) domain-containing protein